MNATPYLPHRCSATHHTWDSYDLVDSMDSASVADSPLLGGAERSAPASNAESQTTVSDLEDNLAANDYLLDAEADGNDDHDPIAVCGFSLKFPQEATSAEGLWKMMMAKRCAMTEFPAERLNSKGFHQDAKRANTLSLRGGHFVKDDLAVFDADFFGISPTEAASMDPMQRWLLEATYGAMENAGIPMEELSGSQTGVYTGSFGMDYMLQLIRDGEYPAPYAAVGFGLSMLANRVSWFFNLHGPSIGLDSACSSSAMAVDFACQALRNGSCETALVAGANLANSPEPYIFMSNLSFLSPDSRCHSFDHRANGYARGEGIAVVVLKKLSAAIRDGNTIRAVIRATGSNEDGRTPGITQPSQEAQERLIRETYRKAGLSMAQTRFFEAHGTGTPTGDPREAQAIGLAFQKHRSLRDPLHVGAIKSNIGHLEGASGLAGFIKTVLVLEKGIIPPNTNFEKVNPKIDTTYLRLKFPQEARPWPTAGLRRASVNSFGYGGSNSHIILDDAYNYMRQRSLPGKHCTARTPPELHPPIREAVPPDTGGFSLETPKILVWSTADKSGIDRVVQDYRRQYSTLSDVFVVDPVKHMNDLAFTLDSHRSRLQWRAFSLVSSIGDLERLRASPPIRVRSEAPRLGFVFSGQGAQWYAMGRELMNFRSFKEELCQADVFLKTLGCPWSVKDELLKTETESQIDSPSLSQALCTILQVAVANLLARFGVRPSAVVGHSSGEIAAAYASGSLSQESAWKVAYYRGFCSAELIAASNPSQHAPVGAMMSVGLPEANVVEYLDSIREHARSFGISIACVNSPVNVTVSGEEHLVRRLRDQLDGEGIFARILRVPVAYHSRQMEAIAHKYEQLIGSLAAGEIINGSIPMISSVTGTYIPPNQLVRPSYWIMNMVSPVLFSQAVSVLCARSPAEQVKKIDRSHVFEPTINYLLEIGPHAALQGPIRDILSKVPRKEVIGYTSVLRRKQSATITMLTAMGDLYCMGVPVILRKVNEPQHHVHRSMLIDLPSYPFDHSQRYWHESRLSRNYRLREHAPSELLGVRSTDWNASDARWRLFIRLSEMPWVEQHVVNGTILYPGAGMLVMAIEGAKQLTHETRLIDGFTLRDVSIEGPIDLTASAGVLEVQTSLRVLPSKSPSQTSYEFHIRSSYDDEWRLNCRGNITVEFADQGDDWVRSKTLEQRKLTSEHLASIRDQCDIFLHSPDMYKFLSQSGYEYGPLFQAATQRYSSHSPQAVSNIKLYASSSEPHVIHPTSLDVILHLCFTAFTSGGSHSMATAIPTRIGHMWISSTGLAAPEIPSVTACSTVESVSKRGFTFSGGALSDETNGELRLWFDDVEVTNITSTPPPLPEQSLLPDPTQFCMKIDRKVALNKLTSNETEVFLTQLHPETEDLSLFFHDIEVLVSLSLKKLVEHIKPLLVSGGDDWKQQYLSWAQHHVHRNELGQTQSSSKLGARRAQESFEDLTERLMNTNHVGKTYATVARDLFKFFHGAAAPLDTLLQSGLLTKYYEELGTYRNNAQAASYLDLLAHEKPGLRILEVGGGTGSATRNYISALSSGSPHATTSLRCSRYDFTDISAAFLEKAREEFVRFHSQMSFGTIDVERSFAEQGYEEGSYDVVVADNVLHVSSDLNQTLRNVRKALKPGGKLILHELLRPDGWTAGFIFGLFPGWWLGAGNGRTLSPNLGVEDWHSVLKENGFSGADLVFKDFADEVSHHLGHIVSSASTESAVQTDRISPELGSITIIVDSNSRSQWSLANSLSSKIERVGQQPEIRDLAHVVTHLQSRVANGLVILLLDYNTTSFLSSLDEGMWTYLRTLVSISKKLLWVSAGGGHVASPDHGLLDGLSRTLRFEYYGLQIVTLALDLADESSEKTSHLLQVVEEMMSTGPNESYEQEYVEIDGLLHTRRLVEAHDMKLDMEARLMPHEIVSRSVGTARFALSSNGIPGAESGPSYIELQDGLGEIASDMVEIAVRAVSLGLRDRSTAQTSADGLCYGEYCSGVVTRAGPSSGFQTGDYVFTVQSGCFCSQVVSLAKDVIAIPPAVSFTEACKAVALFADIHHALDDVGRIRRGDAVLVHDASAPMGRAALMYLAYQGIDDVWVTVSSDEERTQIVQDFGVAPERVQPEIWFQNPNRPKSQCTQKFDIVFAPNDDASSQLSLAHLQAGGRHISLRTSMATSDKYSTIQSVPNSVNLSIIQAGTYTPTLKSLRYILCLAYYPNFGKVASAIVEYSASDLSDVVMNLEKSADNSPIVVKVSESDKINVQIVNKPKYMLNPHATYVVAGGLGGLGRGLSRWLVQRGARYLLLLSRSGPRTAEAQELLAEFAKQNVVVETPACDITNRELLSSVLEDVSGRMPPVKGCIQATMVMTERIFQQMDFRDWVSTIEPKRSGSWNLHTELPSGLDFFVFTSSMMGMLGSGSLAAYNAGNTYEDALAHYRVANGQHAVALNLGAIPDAGYLVEAKEKKHHIASTMMSKKFALTFVRDVCALLDVACDPSSDMSQSQESCQAVVGIRPVSHWRHLEEVHATMQQPFWGHMHHFPVISGVGNEGDVDGEDFDAAQRKRTVDTTDRLALAGSLTEAAEVVSEALVQRVSLLLGTQESSLEAEQPMHSYGLDSLSAIELRNWVGKVFDVDMPVFEILGGASFDGAGLSIARKVQAKRSE